MKKRMEDIDVATGIVTILVVIGHLVPFDQFIFKLIFSFHMPFYFLKSGFCTNRNSVFKPFHIFFAHKVRYLLIPSLIMNLLSIFVGLATPTSFSDALYFVFVSPGHEWFLMALFFVHIIFYYIVHMMEHIKDTSLQKIIVLFLICILPTLGSLALERGIHDNIFLPFKCTSLCLGLMFVLIGIIQSNGIHIFLKRLCTVFLPLTDYYSVQ